ncbi:MAG: SMI1/KNR4 family protein [Chlamydiales bacterium]|nr:SMI1/KNR4 family protein [Chlamydiales bacterium]
MNFLVRQFFNVEREKGDAHFNEVFFLHEEMNEQWESLSERAPCVPRPWFELSRLSSAERIEFVSDLWLQRLSYHPKGYPALVNFFEKLDDIGIIIHRQSEEEPFAVEMVYSLADNSSFFRGLPPCKEEDLDRLKTLIPYDLPADFLSLFRIHHGFGKLSELGLLQVDAMIEARQNVIDLVLKGEVPMYLQDRLVDPDLLIPFYESFGLVSYQCFYADWYPGSEMGNVYLSGIDYAISDITDRKTWTEQLAFPTFFEWLVYYLQGMSV